ncbi:IS701 family transposase [Streptomyces pseudovenezuelae]|uniref:SRSO17 transposase n=1 Tax=Streptomyces pseudovenezuelae TaxID=67350 RepID=A0ABT6LDY7_9ACTN|nr:SRSO17 transposase [Streptomyces pseudovenezuelae]
METHEVNRLRAALGLFVEDVLASVPRKDQRARGECYLRELMVDGRCKSIRPMAQRLPDGNMQALQQFVSQLPWQWTPVRRRITERLVQTVRPEVWVIDDVPFPKRGRASAGVARQCCGTLGKRANCQVAVSVHAATATASCPLEWELFLPEEWAYDVQRRTAAGVPDEVGHRRLASLSRHRHTVAGDRPDRDQDCPIRYKRARSCRPGPPPTPRSMVPGIRTTRHAPTSAFSPAAV